MGITSLPGTDPSPASLLRRAIEQASQLTEALRLPDDLPAILVDEGVWSPAEAIHRIDCPPRGPAPAALAALAPRLSAEEARAAFDRVDDCWDSFHGVAGVVALARRLISLGAAGDALDALSRLDPGPRGLALARVAADLPVDLRATAVRVALHGLSDARGAEACIAHLALARALPDRRDALVEQGLDALRDGDWPIYPYILQWMAHAGARERAVGIIAREETSSDALAAVLPWCDGDERAELWAMWREACARAIADGWKLTGLRLPLPARGDELAELLALARSRPGPRERAVALAHLASQHRALLDEALEAVRQLAGLDLVLGLVSLLPSLAGAARDEVAREALAALTRPGVERASIYELARAWPWLDPEPPVESYPISPTLPGLRARVVAHLPRAQAGGRRAEALALLAATLRRNDDHHRAGAIAALGKHLPDPAARARALAFAESVACASPCPWIGLAHLLRHVEPGARPELTRRALASLPDDLDEETVRALPPLLEALAPDEAAAIVTRILERGGTSSVNDLWAVCEAALRAGAVRPLAEALLGGRAGHRAEYVLPQLLRHADAELHPRVAAALLEPFEHFGPADVPGLDITRAVPWLTPAERERLVARIPPKPVGSKLSFLREPLIVALARPLAEQGALDLLRPLLATVGRARRLKALASALPFLDKAEREKVTRQIRGDLRRGEGEYAAAHLAAAGHASALLDLVAPLGPVALARVGRHLPADQRPRFLDLLARSLREKPSGVYSSATLRELAPWLGELPRDVLVGPFERALERARLQGRPELFQHFITGERGSDEGGGEEGGDTGLTLALVHLAGPAGLAACVALLEDVGREPA